MNADVSGALETLQRELAELQEDQTFNAILINYSSTKKNMRIYAYLQQILLLEIRTRAKLFSSITFRSKTSRKYE